MKILIIGPDNLTELILVEALVAQLHKRHKCEVDLLIPEALHPLVERFPYIHEVHALPQHSSALALFFARLKLAIQFRKRGYYQAIILQAQFDYVLFPLIAGIHRRTAYCSNNLRHFFHRSLTNDCRFGPLFIHGLSFGRQLDHLLSLANEPGCVLPEKARPQLISHDAKRQALLTKHQLLAGVKPLLVVCPGQDNATSKYWPAEHFAELIDKKIQSGWQVWLMGEAHDQAIGRDVVRCVGSEGSGTLTNLMGSLSLLESLDLITLADAVLGLENGFMHLACALKRPVVALYGPSSPSFRPPLTKHFQVLTQGLACKPCGERSCPREMRVCLNYLRPELVLEALEKLPQPLWES